ncbi:hypothetical protein RJT34_27966 [Clitoria ternatea]|uniref:DDT domain-containing protein n=1 Tax=Clitoria ternatea TaxID=43366 RepID=A0AAN9FDF4_CLITE
MSNVPSSFSNVNNDVQFPPPLPSPSSSNANNQVQVLPPLPPFPSSSSNANNEVQFPPPLPPPSSSSNVNNEVQFPPPSPPLPPKKNYYCHQEEDVPEVDKDFLESICQQLEREIILGRNDAALKAQPLRWFSDSGEEGSSKRFRTCDGSNEVLEVNESAAAWAPNDYCVDFGRDTQGSASGSNAGAMLSQPVNNVFNGNLTQVSNNPVTGSQFGGAWGASDINAPVTLAPPGHNMFSSRLSGVNQVNESSSVHDNGGSSTFTELLESFSQFIVELERDEPQEEIIPLPSGTQLTKIAEVDLPPENVGDALQFLEFCRVFGKAVDVEKGEAEAMLRELVGNENLSHGTNNLVVRFQIRLLSVIQNDSGKEYLSLGVADGDDSWFKTLKNLLTQSRCVLKDFPLGWLEERVSGYHKLDLSKKLKLLNFLCDQALGTKKLRSYIVNENETYLEGIKETRAKVVAAEKKEMDAKERLHDEMQRTVYFSSGPCTKEDHDIIEKLRSEVAEAHAEMLQAKEGIIPKRNKL